MHLLSQTMDSQLSCDKNCKVCDETCCEDDEDIYSDAHFHQDLDRILLSAGAVVAVAAIAIGYFSYTKYTNYNVK